jgi:hypothetical protein
MSKFEHVDLADRFAAGVRYVAAGDRRGASKPGLDALVIGDPEGIALVMEGTADQLRVFVAKMAAQLPPTGKGRCDCGTSIEQGPAGATAQPAPAPTTPQPAASHRAGPPPSRPQLGTAARPQRQRTQRLRPSPLRRAATGTYRPSHPVPAAPRSSTLGPGASAGPTPAPARRTTNASMTTATKSSGSAAATT